MKDTGYLIIGRNGIRGFRKSRPSLNWDEVSCAVSIDIPDQLFMRPMLNANINVDESVVSPQEIPTELILNTKELIEQQTGCKVNFELHDMREKEDE